LALWILVKATHTDAADTMTLQNPSKEKSVREKSMSLSGICQEIDRKALFQVSEPDIRLG